MKISLGKLITLSLVIIATAFNACKDDPESAQPFGMEEIYIPQATVSGGTNHNYAVPTGFDANTFNYKVDGNKVNILLGVLRGGKPAAAETYTVDVSTRTDTVMQMINDGTLSGSKPYVVLPAGSFSLPQKVTVPAGEDGSSFNLSVDKSILQNNAGKMLVICVVISNPTNYSISTSNNKVIVIIDVDSLNPA